MKSELPQLLKIPGDRLEQINEVLLNPDTKIIQAFLDVVAKYGTPEEINRKAAEARRLENLFAKVRQGNPDNLKDLYWLEDEANQGKFISVSGYREKVLGEVAKSTKFADDFAVTLEVSALQYFPWVREMVTHALDHQTLVPGRFIKVRKMKEQEADGDLPAIHIEIPTVDGGRAKVTVPHGAQTGQQFRLKGKGMSVLRSQSRGDMYVELSVETPVNLTKKQKELLTQFEAESKKYGSHSPQSQGFFARVKEFFDSSKD